MSPKICQWIPSPKYILTLISYDPKSESCVVNQIIEGVYFLQLFRNCLLKAQNCIFLFLWLWSCPKFKPSFAYLSTKFIIKWKSQNVKNVTFLLIYPLLRSSNNLAFHKKTTLIFWLIASQSQNIFWRWNPLTDLWRHFFPWYFPFKRTV